MSRFAGRAALHRNKGGPPGRDSSGEFMKKIAFFSATTALFVPAAAFAQSTGTIEVEEPAIVVTGTRVSQGVEGIVIPDTAKAQQALTNEQLLRAPAGQTVLNAINIVPGVNFTQNDPFGSSGGSIRIRGFDGNRISLTFDGLPLNDTGNYSIYSNQQLDPELIEQVNVNLGQTDVDSPTASAAGGTVNYRTIIPRRQVGARVNASVGDFDFRRLFGMLETGEWFDGGPRAFVSASYARNDLFRGAGEIYKQQYNARIYQDLGGGDFVSVSGHWNQNRNNQYRNPSIGDVRTLTGNPALIPLAGAISATNPAIIGEFGDAQWDTLYSFGNEAFCNRPTFINGTVQRETTTPTNTTPLCTSYFNVRINPSDTGNVRINSRFTLADNLILTVDPSYQYTLANGGGITTLAENSARARGSLTTGGVDFNGDGDILDTVQFFTPNNTNTHRYGLTASLIWTPAPEHRFRVAYTYDRGRHRQTGEWGFLDRLGNPENVFGGRIDSGARPVLTADGYQIQQRDRLSIALLNQIAGQYVGRYFDERLRVEVGLRVPFFERELNQFCLTEARGGGFAYCTSENIPASQIIAPGSAVPATGPTPYFAPFEQTYKFDAVLPNIGLVYNLTPRFSVFGSYAKGFSAPRTDNLYRAPIVEITPEKTDAFDLGLRYRSRGLQAQATAWLINYQNRILSTFDPDQGISIDRNVGKVESWGVDASIAWQPIEPVTLYAFGSYINAEFQEDVLLGRTNAPGAGQTVPAGTPIFAPTAGKMVAETPEWQLGGRVQLALGPVDLGLTGKWVDDRFATDVNDVVVRGYTTFDLDARFNLAQWGLDRTYLQLNVVNLFDERYIGNIGTQINAGNICPIGANCSNNGATNVNFTPGAPRTFIATLNVGF